jgi:hypothetical protein
MGCRALMRSAVGCCPPTCSARGVARALTSLAAMSSESTESEVLARELDSLGNKLRAVETRLVEVERIIEGLEAAALTTARALEEVSTHWDQVYRAMRRAE